MKRRKVHFSESSRNDLNLIYSQIAAFAGPEVAFSYIERLRAYCLKFDLVSERGQRHDELAKGLRIIGFERRVTIAFTVTESDVVILRLFYGGVDWQDRLF